MRFAEGSLVPTLPLIPVSLILVKSCQKKIVIKKLFCNKERKITLWIWLGEKTFSSSAVPGNTQASGSSLLHMCCSKSSYLIK